MPDETRNELLTVMTDTVRAQRAINIQPFTERNSKSGTQYEAAFYTSMLASGGGILDIAIEVGTKKMLVKALDALFDSELITHTYYANPTYTGGTVTTVYNLNDGNAVAGEAVLKFNVSTTDPGTQISPTIRSIGTSGQGNRAIATEGLVQGVERVLSESRNYLLRIVNEDATNDSAISFLMTWYEGILSTEIE